jgi:hypothetical protein
MILGSKTASVWHHLPARVRMLPGNGRIGDRNTLDKLVPALVYMPLGRDGIRHDKGRLNNTQQKTKGDDGTHFNISACIRRKLNSQSCTSTCATAGQQHGEPHVLDWAKTRTRRNGATKKDITRMVTGK